MTEQAKPLKMALPKGELHSHCLSALEEAGYSVSALREGSRKLTFSVPEDGIEYILCRPSDIPVFVEYGAADMGMVGKDVLMEAGKNLYELADLGFGGCRFVLAGPAGNGRPAENYRHLGHLRIATKYPRVTEEYFARKGIQVEIIKLRGAIELAPLVGLAEQIVDLSSTGRTLKENNLEVVEVIAECTARLVSNVVSQKLRFMEIRDLTRRLMQGRGAG